MKNPSIYLIGAILFAHLSGCSSQRPLSEIPRNEVKITNLGPAVNSESNDFSPTVTANGTKLYFTSGRGGKDRASNFWVSTINRGSWSVAEKLGPPFLEEDYVGNPSISADGQTIYFASLREDGIGEVDIYSAKLHGSAWGEITGIGSGVNTEDWDSQPSISHDGNTLYFVSDRAGGSGGLDIWMSERNPSGEWSPAVNAGPVINTSGNEVSPFIAADNMTLYFSSDGHAGRSGTDLFVTRRIQGQWSVPENMGLPINSEGNDEFLTLTAAGTVIYFASEREGGIGGLDLYRAEPNPYPPQPVVVVSGMVMDANTRAPIETELTVRNAYSGAFTAKHESNELSGEYVIVLPAGGTYSITSTQPPYLPDSAVFDLTDVTMYGERSHDFLLLREQTAATLNVYIGSNIRTTDFTILDNKNRHAGLLIEEIQAGETVPLLPYIFFNEHGTEIDERYETLKPGETGSFDVGSLPYGVMPKYRNLLNIVGSRMIRYPAAMLTITGTLAKDELDEGLDLAQSRAETVKTYLTAVWEIDGERIQIKGLESPANPSSEETVEGMDENRRAELSSGDERILAPVITRSVERFLTPETAVFYPRVLSDNSVETWELSVEQEGRILFQRVGSGSVPDSITWNWRDENGDLPQANVPITYALNVKDGESQAATTAEHTIPVTLVTLRNKSEKNLPDRTIERIHLILFEFDKSKLNIRQRNTLEALDGFILPRSNVTIIGYTDAIGKTTYNEKLSLKRAEEVRSILRRKYPDVTMRTEGAGESFSLFKQDKPEGRFYSRTVVIVIETAKL